MTGLNINFISFTIKKPICINLLKSRTPSISLKPFTTYEQSLLLQYGPDPDGAR